MSAFDYASIIDRASSATTLAEECDVIRDALCAFIPGKVDGHKLGLLDAVRDARTERTPRATLLGVVSSLIPDGANFTVSDIRGASVIRDGVGYPAPPTMASTPALCLLVSICRALSGEEGGASHD